MKKSLLFLPALLMIASCGIENPESTLEQTSDKVVYILNEGGYGQNNASLSRVDLASGAVTNDLFATLNGSPLGDTANDIITTKDMIIIAVNGSNLIQFCDKDGKAIGQTEVPSCRKMASDGKYLYVTSYADDGTLYKIDMSTYRISGTVKTGYEPEGVAIFNGKVYVANSGGYAYLGTHGYEDTISIIDPETMKESRRVATGKYNLYGAFLQNSKFPQYILVNASGDYMSNPACSFIFDCVSEKVVAEFDFPATYAAQTSGLFYSLGSSFSYETYAYEYFTNKIEVSAGGAIVSPWTLAGLEDMASPYGIVITSEGDLFVGDAGDYSTRGSLYRYDSDGQIVSRETVGVCPGHFATR